MNKNPGLKAWVNEELPLLDTKYVQKDPGHNKGGWFNIYENHLIGCMDVD